MPLWLLVVALLLQTLALPVARADVLSSERMSVCTALGVKWVDAGGQKTPTSEHVGGYCPWCSATHHVGLPAADVVSHPPRQAERALPAPAGHVAPVAAQRSYRQPPPHAPPRSA